MDLNLRSASKHTFSHATMLQEYAGESNAVVLRVSRSLQAAPDFDRRPAGSKDLGTSFNAASEPEFIAVLTADHVP